MLTANDCLKTIGDPILEKDMVLWDVPSQLEIGVIPKRIYCNKRMVKPLEAAFRRLIQTGCVSELKTWDGCFNIRSKRRGTSYSLHSWGVAIDINAAWNPMGKPGTFSKEFVECFREASFDWGGDWAVPDPMHFQLKEL